MPSQASRWRKKKNANSDTTGSLSPVEQQLIVGHRTAEVKPPPPPPVAFRLVMLTMMMMLTMITMILMNDDDNYY